ncbi:HNH endonuclease signature motif containing protein [Tsukamurella sp. 1534]|uniref:HNH endonuclease signature motif containing protein n=1 Tax=Tsukamurella sp. 1534 TaxID=1151061 RepID=UPI0002F716AC|nr:HNH endonuclease signature motif containing protein [Tsukamurella sp. 1534]
MNVAPALQNLPEALLPPRFTAAGVGMVGSGELVTVLEGQRRCENLAYCRTITAVYALFRDRYGERESAFLASEPEAGIDFYRERRELSLAYSSAKAEISVALRQEALSRARTLTGAQALAFDERLAELLTADPLQLTSLPALREAADRVVHDIDPAAAERRRAQAEEDRTLTIRPADDGMAAAYALLTAHEGRELGVRVEEIAATVCEDDSRTVAQRRADGLLMLVRGFVTLGCRCANPGCSVRGARHLADGALDPEGARVVTRYRTLIHVVVNGRTLADPADTHAAYLIGHGPITAQHARDLAAREDAVLRPFGDEIATPAAEHATAAAAPFPGLQPDDAPSPDAQPDRATPSDAQPDRTTPSAAQPDRTTPSAAQPDRTTPSAAQPDGTSRPGPAQEDERPPVEVPGFRSSGVDLARKAPAPILAAARCRRGAATGETSTAEPTTPADGRTLEEPDCSKGTSPTAPEPQGTDQADRAAPTPPPASSPAPAPPPAQTLPPATAPPPLVIARGSGGYRFSADLTRYFTLLYPRCVFPLCTRPSSRCQLDHRREYDHRDPGAGRRSTADNGQPLCLAHHQLKTAGVWTDAHLPDGRILWIGPAGQRIVVDPSGTVLGLFPDLARITWTTPDATDTPPKPRNPGGPTHLQREHARREALRATHIAAMEHERRQQNTSRFERHLVTVLDGRDPAHAPPPDDEPPPF